jgi:hypothetical protein
LGTRCRQGSRRAADRPDLDPPAPHRRPLRRPRRPGPLRRSAVVRSPAQPPCDHAPRPAPWESSVPIPTAPLRLAHPPGATGGVLRFAIALYAVGAGDHRPAVRRAANAPGTTTALPHARRAAPQPRSAPGAARGPRGISRLPRIAAPRCDRAASRPRALAPSTAPPWPSAVPNPLRPAFARPAPA